MSSSHRTELKNKLNSLLDDIHSLLLKPIHIKNKDLQFGPYQSPRGYWQEYRTLIEDYTDAINERLKYLSNIDIGVFVSILSEIKNSLEVCYEKLSLGEENQSDLAMIIDIINKLKIIDEIHILYVVDEDYTVNDVLEFIDSVEFKLSYPRIDELKEYVLENPFDQSITILQHLIPLKNKSGNVEVNVLNARFEFDRVLDFSIKLKQQKTLLIDLDSQLSETIKQVQESKLTIDESRLVSDVVNKKTADAQDNELLVIFSNDYEKLDESIYRLNAAIIVIFLVILSGYIIVLSLIGNAFETKHYLIYISSLLFSSGLLGYLVKDRNRIIRDYEISKKLHLETKAMSGYMASLSKIESNKLRIDLAPNYFTGNKINEETSKSNDEVSRVINTLDEIKKLINTK